MDDPPHFGAWLKQRRRALDLTQRELAQYVGCSEVAIRKIEAGEYRPSKQIAERLAEYLEIEPGQIEAFTRFARGEPRLTASAPPQSSTQALQAWLGTEATPHRRSELPNNIPGQLTPLIGRETATAGVLAFLVDEGVRLLTLAGPPGVGKTRLALEVASELANPGAHARQDAEVPRFADGIFFVDLSAVSDPGLVASAIAQTLGVKEAGERTLLENLHAHLRDKRVLLVLDNFEQVVRAAPQVLDLLARCDRLSVLATSREVLRLRGEQQYPVQPLELPDPSSVWSIEDLSGNPAVKLFVERARHVKPGFTLNDENAEAIAAICSRLDGLPLAIEIAAARVKVLSCQAIRARLESRLDLLVTGPRDGQGRQETLRGAIAWSYNLLDPGEQKLFGRLAVFAGGATLAAVEAVCNALGDLPIVMLDGLASLLDKSLLREEEPPGEDIRYAMLDTIREYALEVLSAQEGQWRNPEMGRSHAEYYLTLAEAAETELRGSRQISWLKRLEREHGNLRAALTWAERHDLDIYLRMVVALWRFWWLRGHLSEGRERLRVALSLPGLAEGRRLIWRARALRGAGWLTYTQGDYAAARTLFEQSLALFRRVDDKPSIAACLDNLGAIAFTLNDNGGARRLYEQSLEIRRLLGDKHAVATSLNNLGLVAASQADFETAGSLLDESVGIYRQLGDGYGIATSLNNLALVARGLGKYNSARPLLDESLETRRDMGDKYAIAYSLAGFAGLSAGLAFGGAPGAHRHEHALHATRLLAATAAVLDAIGARLENAYRIEYDRNLALLRSELGEAVFAREWTEGQAMSVQQAIQFALSPYDTGESRSS